MWGREVMVGLEWMAREVGAMHFGLRAREGRGGMEGKVRVQTRASGMNELVFETMFGSDVVEWM